LTSRRGFARSGWSFFAVIVVRAMRCMPTTDGLADGPSALLEASTLAGKRSLRLTAVLKLMRRGLAQGSPWR
jgi:hypothetical protein